MEQVFTEICENYRLDRVTECLTKIFDGMGGLSSFVKPGTRVAIKPNLLTFKRPEEAATTNPAVVRAVTSLVQKEGGLVTIVESPGGPYNVPLLKRVYAVTGMEDVAKETGAQLNFDLRVEKVENPNAKYIKSLKVLKPLHDADLIINIAKLKTHGMMVYTGAVKNMFGSIAGLEKADYHMRLNDYDRFADSLIDIFQATGPQINLIDGIIAMEGDGPGSGVPKYLGVMIGSKNAFAADYAASMIIGVDYKQIPILKMAEVRGLLKKNEVSTSGVALEAVKTDSFDVPALKAHKTSRFLKLLGFLGNFARPRPQILVEKCIACGKCAQMCPPKIITKGSDNRMAIDYSKCISCFCCHEFCPEKAVRIRRNTLGRIMEYKRISK